MGKLLEICKKCGWKHLDWEPCRADDGSSKIIGPPPLVVPKIIRKVNHEGEASANKSRSKYMAERRRGAKWALAKILDMIDVEQIHALAKSVLER